MPRLPGIHALVLMATFAALGPSGVPAAAQEGRDHGGGDTARVAGPVSPDSADALRAALVRPSNGHPVRLGDVLSAPFEVALYPLNLLTDGVTWAVGEVLEVRPPGAVERLVRSLGEAGVRPGVSTDLGPRAGVGLELVYDGVRPLVVETAFSHRGDQRHAVALQWGEVSQGFRVEGSFRRYAEPWVWGIGMGQPHGARADYAWDRWAAVARVALAREERTVHDLRFRLGVEENAVGDGSDDGVPDVGEAFPPGALPGADDPTRFAFAGARAEVDLLDRDTLDVSGLRGSVEVEGFEGLADTPTRFLRVRGELEGLVTVTGRHLFGLVGRAAVIREDGGAVPFTHLAELGGDEGLRAYDPGRFRDRDLVSLGAEWRWEVWRELRERGRVEAFLFHTQGGVTHDLTKEFPETVPSTGVGLRVLWLGDYQGESFVAFGEDGARFGVSVDVELNR